MRLILAALVAALCATADAVCCPSRSFSFNEPKCGDGSAIEGTYCGLLPCNYFGCNCLFGCHHASGLRFEAGDIIACYMDLAPSDAPDWHVMLAINKTEVIHISDLNHSYSKYYPFAKFASSLYKNWGPIKKEIYQDVIQKHSYTHCQVVTEFMDRIAMDYGLEPQSLEDMIADAHASLNHTYTNSPTCEYMATRWRYHHGFIVQHVTEWQYYQAMVEV